MEEWEEGVEHLSMWLHKDQGGVTETQRDQLKRFCSYLYYSSGKINLISERDRRMIAIKHVLPSLSMAGLLAAVPNAKVLDLGSGAGLPGIPLKVVFPESYFYLVESRRKRANFLRGAIRNLGLREIEVCNERIEALHASMEQGVDVVVSRATRELAGLLDWVRPVLKPHGLLIASLDQGRGLGKAKAILVRRQTEWVGVTSWYAGVR